MAITIAKENYPSFASGVGVSGKRQVLYVNYGEGATKDKPVWTLLGGLETNTLSISADTSTVQTKESGYWADGTVTNKSYELSADVIMKRDNAAQQAIEEFLLDDAITAEKGALNIAVVYLDTKEYLSLVVVPKSWEITADGKDMIKKKLSATGVGEPKKMTGFVAAAG